MKRPLLLFVLLSGLLSQTGCAGSEQFARENNQEGAVEEMGQAYAEGIKALQTPGHLVAVIVLTAAIAVLGIWLCAKVDKKSSKLLD